ncbi:uncharacterized protein CEXT_402511 [Caerostris extrusa]|uniref:Ig-like domain-containing protein n=1 Tax=Caerostris extrusa TaxID=172846 RepID=A0AAV4V9S4_CAEEX|nr:uncharacterized protein CEXT_402511 [Caerostris extrusa]
MLISEEGGAGIIAVGSPPLRASIHVTATARNDVSVNGLSSFACHDNGWTENNGSSKSSLLLLRRRRGWRACDPSPNVTWWKGSMLFDNDFSVIKQRFVRNELVLTKIKRSDLMVEYTCKASNTPIAKPRTASVQLDMNRKYFHSINS